MLVEHQGDGTKVPPKLNVIHIILHSHLILKLGPKAEERISERRENDPILNIASPSRPWCSSHGTYMSGFAGDARDCERLFRGQERMRR